MPFFSKRGLLRASALLLSTAATSHAFTQGKKLSSQPDELSRKTKKLLQSWDMYPIKPPRKYDKHKKFSGVRILAPLEERQYCSEEDFYSHQIIERAKHIRKIYGETHFVFIHAQSTDLIPADYFINALAAKAGMPQYEFFKYVRMPKEPSAAFKAKVATCISKVQHSPGRDGDINDNDPFAREIMLSADIEFDHEKDKESARDFLRSNRSCILERQHLDAIIHKILPGENTVSEEVVEQIASLGHDISKYAPCGNLLVFCIPKDLFNPSNNEKPAYRSHGWGAECDCHSPQEEKWVFETLQMGKASKEYSEALCHDERDMSDYDDDAIAYAVKSRDLCPQARIIISRAKPEDGVLCFMVNPLTKPQRKEVKRVVKPLADKYHEARLVQQAQEQRQQAQEQRRKEEMEARALEQRDNDMEMLYRLV